MTLQSLKIENFRNVKEAEMTFKEGINFLKGENAQGKTNALEAIYFFARGKSFRGSEDDMVRFGEKGFFCEIKFFDGKRTQTLSHRFYEGKRVRKKNGAPVSRISEMMGVFRAVLFSPDHLQMVKGSPDIRRQFLNVGISQLQPSYLKLYSQYNKMLENRNYLLKCAQKGLYFDESELSVWSSQIAEVAASLHFMRLRFLEQIERHAKVIMAEVSEQKETLSLSYESENKGETEQELQEIYRAQFSQNLKKEFAAGCTLYGVHRDDFKIEINGIDARHFASQGQQRSVVLALKLAEGEACACAFGEYPVFLFDDVLSELDEKRRAYVFKGKEKRQFIVTTCEKEILEGSHVIEVKEGKYVSFD
ncbi:MAG: DNA replication/repair protein RecF [Clostridia bacterium]|nr:DNA replication/repair protein RecF [Clostridia bacterium]